MASKPRIKIPSSAKVGDVIEIKTLITHDMETGQRKDPKTGKLIPRDIIKTFVAKFNGEEVFRTEMNPAVSANPYISFFVTVPGSGDFEFIWTDDKGQTWSVKEPLKAS